MKISELVAKLNKIKEKAGDIPVCYETDEEQDYEEFIDAELWDHPEGPVALIY